MMCRLILKVIALLTWNRVLGRAQAITRSIHEGNVVG